MRKLLSSASRLGVAATSGGASLRATTRGGGGAGDTAGAVPEPGADSDHSMSGSPAISAPESTAIASDGATIGREPNPTARFGSSKRPRDRSAPHPGPL